MITPGLVSVTFRKLSPAEIVALVRQAGLAGIEWGGDIHVPHGAVARAKEVRQLTLDAGLQVIAYGSYYRLDGRQFEAVLESAVTLGAPVIRVWAGGMGSAQATAEQRAAVVADARRIGDLAAAAGIKIAFEYHGNTLTDTDESAQRLLAEVAHPNVFTLWQPRITDSVEANLTGLRAIRSRLLNVHVYHWKPNPLERRPLAEGADCWRRYFGELAGARAALLEFVVNDDPAQFLRDAAVLRELVAPRAGTRL
jgi:sugar phosphate isomerase/epimerase